MAENEHIIKIPHIDINCKMGEVLLAIFSIIEETEQFNESVVWDFANVDYLHPFFINALTVYQDGLITNVKEINVSDGVACVMKNIQHHSPVEFTEGDLPYDKLSGYVDAGLSPMCKFSRKYAKIDELQTVLFSMVGSKIKKIQGNWSPNMAIAYLIGELTCNIQEHSRASNGYLSIYPNELDDSVYICVADNGISVHGCFMQSDKAEYVRLIGSDHAEALKYCTKGISTKNRPDNESRGYGVSTNLNMIVNGLGGEFFMLSGKAFFICDEFGEQFVNLPENMNWDGSIILVKIPLKQRDEFSVYKYIE